MKKACTPTCYTPGFMNPGLEECALCALQIALDEFPKLLKRAVKQQDKQRG